MTRKMIITASLILAGCSSATYKQDPIDNIGDKLDPNIKAYVLTPENGSYDGKEYKESGRATAEALRDAVAQHAKSVSVIKTCQKIECHQLENTETEAYYFVPEIIHWEDRATEWSGISDKVKIRVTVFNSKKTEISANSFFGKSKYWTLGGDHPEDLLEKPMKRYAESLYK